MNKIEIGDYVRTKDGIIAKCIEEKQDKYIFNKIVLEQGYYNNYIFKDIPERANFILKHSKDIIDLIEVGDYVNGLLVHGISDFGVNVYMYGDAPVSLSNNEIKSIVTHQQFKEMEYRL